MIMWSSLVLLVAHVCSHLEKMTQCFITARRWIVTFWWYFCSTVQFYFQVYVQFTVCIFFSFKQRKHQLERYLNAANFDFSLIHSCLSLYFFIFFLIERSLFSCFSGTCIVHGATEITFCFFSPLPGRQVSACRGRTTCRTRMTSDPSSALCRSTTASCPAPTCRPAAREAGRAASIKTTPCTASRWAWAPSLWPTGPSVWRGSASTGTGTIPGVTLGIKTPTKELSTLTTSPTPGLSSSRWELKLTRCLMTRSWRSHLCFNYFEILSDYYSEVFHYSFI